MLSLAKKRARASRSEIYKTGDLVIDIGAHHVFRKGQEIHLAELSFDALKVLLRHAPNVVSKKQLMDEVWQGIIVEPGTIKKRITLLRESLDDDTQKESLIRIIRGRGYAISEPVERLDPSDSKRRRERYRLGLLVILLLLVIGLALKVSFLTNQDNQRPQVPEEYEMLCFPEMDLIETERAQHVRISNTDSLAYDSYLEGRMLRNMPNKLNDSIIALERAIDIDPNFAPAYAELSMARLGGPGREQEKSKNTEKSRRAAQRALELDPLLPEAYVAAGAVALYLDLNLAEAESLITSGLSHEPDNVYLLAYLSTLMKLRGEFDTAEQLGKPFLLDKISDAHAHYSHGQNLYFSGKYPEAIEAYRRALTLNPQLPYAHMAIGRVLALQGDPGAAIDEMELETSPRFQLYGLVIAHTASGNEKAAITLLGEFTEECAQSCPYWIGTLHAFRKRTNSAIEWLESAYDLRDIGLLNIKIDPLLTGIHEDPRFKNLLTRMQLN